MRVGPKDVSNVERALRQHKKTRGGSYMLNKVTLVLFFLGGGGGRQTSRDKPFFQVVVTREKGTMPLPSVVRVQFSDFPFAFRIR